MAVRVLQCADLGILAAVEELEELDDELDVADAAAAGLDLDLGRAGGDGPLLDPPLHRLDLADLRRRSGSGGRRTGVIASRKVAAEVEVAGDRRGT